MPIEAFKLKNSSQILEIVKGLTDDWKSDRDECEARTDATIDDFARLCLSKFSQDFPADDDSSDSDESGIEVGLSKCAFFLLSSWLFYSGRYSSKKQKYFIIQNFKAVMPKVEKAIRKSSLIVIFSYLSSILLIGVAILRGCLHSF